MCTRVSTNYVDAHLYARKPLKTRISNVHAQLSASGCHLQSGLGASHVVGHVFDHSEPITITRVIRVSRVLKIMGVMRVIRVIRLTQCVNTFKHIFSRPLSGYKLQSSCIP